MTIQIPQKLHDLLFVERSNIWKNYDDSMGTVITFNKLSKKIDVSESNKTIPYENAEINYSSDEFTTTVIKLQRELNRINNARQQVIQIRSKIESIKKTDRAVKIVMTTIIILGIIAAIILFPNIITLFKWKNIIEIPIVESVDVSPTSTNNQLSEHSVLGQQHHPSKTIEPVQPNNRNPPIETRPHIKPVEPVIFTLTVRSNVHGDTVFINGENYGSTRLDVKLPIGVYTVRVEKFGYISEEKQIDLQSTLTERFILRKDR